MYRSFSGVCNNFEYDPKSDSWNSYFLEDLICPQDLVFQIPTYYAIT